LDKIVKLDNHHIMRLFVKLSTKQSCFKQIKNKQKRGFRQTLSLNASEIGIPEAGERTASILCVCKVPTCPTYPEGPKEAKPRKCIWNKERLPQNPYNLPC
jgi:hypothetical protein